VTRQSAAEAARRDRAALDAARVARLAGLVDRARGIGLREKIDDLGELRDEVFEHGSTARHELRRIDEALERAAKLREEVDAARVEHRIAHTLGELLKSDHFEKWVLAEALGVLVDAASRTLLSLSQGHYSLRYSSDEEFVVVDHRNADETRSVRTLSGGETFQAALALALALSDQLAELSAAGGAKLDAIFCDEGFGSLDADTLDAVASTIESLATSGRVVGLVTHVPALAERVPVRFRVHDGTVTREET
jgi:exonuclease SbcC